MNKKAQNYYKKKLDNFSDKKDRILNQKDINIKNVKNIHITGSCGKAMASISGLFSDAGFNISGSDNNCKPPMSIVLDNLGLKYHNYNENNIPNKDLIVVGNVCTPQNIEALYARNNNIPQISGAEAVGKFFIGEKKSLVLAGTHGKTTSSSLLSHIFITAKKTTGFLVGGVLENYNTSYKYEKKKDGYFIIEGDEYDTAYFDKAPKFLHYKPYKTIITSIEYDHADIYKDLQDYQQAFKFLIQETKEEVIIFDEIKNLDEIIENMEDKITTYGFDENSDIYISNIRQSTNGQLFNLKIIDKEYKDIFLAMSGRHNILNATACLYIALSENISEDDIRKSLKTFKGSKKRQEVIGDKNNIIFIDDFAHHPTAVKTTLDGIKEQYPKKRVVVVFEPRSSTSRMKIFENTYPESFNSADVVFISQPNFREVDKEDNFMDIKKIKERLIEKGKDVFTHSNIEDLKKEIIKKIEGDDVVIFMSNGDFDDIQNKVINSL